MRDFWLGNNRLVDDTEWYGSGGAGIVLSGQDWLGLGQIFGSASAGTELCGARPVFAGKSRDEWEDCNKKALVIIQNQSAQQAVLTQQQIKATQDIEKRKRITIIVVVSLVSLAGIVAIALVMRKRKRK
jgi:hypothetical protein